MNIFGKGIRITRLRVGNGFSGRAVLSPIASREFSKSDWTNSLAQPSLLFENVEKILKKEAQNCVAVKTLMVGGKPLKVVIKRHHPQLGLRQFFRSFAPGRAIRNFKTAIKLLHYGIPVAIPLVALHQRKNLLITQSIYITEYSENSCNLYNFASNASSQLVSHEIRKQLCFQLAAILAMLHKNNLWHRDSKASNFIVSKDAQGKYKIFLTDMDGIKPYLFRRKSCQFRSLWQLAASFIPVPTVNRTDYLRMFIAYCNLIGLEVSQRRQLFRQLASRARAKWLRSMPKPANQQLCPKISKTS